jgi:hypothetical protein
MKRAASSNVFSYYLRNKLYLSLTNECNSLNSVTLRGPSFQMPATSGFALIPKGLDFVEPTAEQVADAVEAAFDEGKIEVGSMEADEITYAGFGEPLLRLDVLTNSAKLIKSKVGGGIGVVFVLFACFLFAFCFLSGFFFCFLSFRLLFAFFLLSVWFLFAFYFCFCSFPVSFLFASCSFLFGFCLLPFCLLLFAFSLLSLCFLFAVSLLSDYFLLLFLLLLLFAFSLLSLCFLITFCFYFCFYFCLLSVCIFVCFLFLLAFF